MSKKQDRFMMKVGLGLRSSILLLALALGMAAALQPAVGMSVPDAPESVLDAPEAFRMVVPDAPESVLDSPEALRMVVPDAPE